MVEEDTKEARGLVESQQRNESLEDEVSELANALRTLCADSRLSGDVPPSVLELVARVSSEVYLTEVNDD